MSTSQQAAPRMHEPRSALAAAPQRRERAETGGSGSPLGPRRAPRHPWRQASLRSCPVVAPAARRSANGGAEGHRILSAGGRRLSSAAPPAGGPPSRRGSVYQPRGLPAGSPGAWKGGRRLEREGRALTRAGARPPCRRAPCQGVEQLLKVPRGGGRQSNQVAGRTLRGRGWAAQGFPRWF